METSGRNALRGADIIAAIKESGIATVVALPDIVTSDETRTAPARPKIAIMVSAATSGDCRMRSNGSTYR